MSHDLLLEIGTEELPAGFIDRALEQMRTDAAAGLGQLRLSFTDLVVYGTPRRLALLVRGLAERQDDLVKQSKGPSRRVAFADDGTPTKAAEGFARGQGVAVAELEVRDTEQGEYVFAVTREAGRLAAAVLEDWLSQFVTNIQFPKSMRWGTGTVRFARPLRWLVALLGDSVLRVAVGDVQAGASTYGHRFLAPDEITLSNPDEYVERLRSAYVLVDGAERKAAVERHVSAAAAAAGGRVVDDGSLAAEVANLIEYPAAVVGSFTDEYLTLPREVLITPMREHQRYFPLADEDGGLLPQFIAVSNGPRPEPEVVRTGNEKVLAARLADARFFFDEDRKRPLSANVEALKNVVFQQQLGTVFEKTARIQTLAEGLGAELGVDDGVVAVIRQGARLAKADLVTQMVHEFPELQGVMGREYARLAGEDDAVATVIYEHYLPRHAGDVLPQTDAGRAVSIADKVDTIVGCFGAGLIPTGSQDPYALRRQALGVVRIAMESQLNIHLGRLLERAYELFEGKLADRAQTLAKVQEFFRQRVRGVLLEHGIRHDVADAVIAADCNNLAAVLGRARALQAFSKAPDFESLMTAYERVANLAGQAETVAVTLQLFEADAERRLYDVATAVAQQLPALMDAGAYDDVFGLLAGLRPHVDGLFADVMVMAPDPDVRQNRLALLRQTLHLFNAPADLSMIVT